MLVAESRILPFASPWPAFNFRLLVEISYPVSPGTESTAHLASIQISYILGVASRRRELIGAAQCLLAAFPVAKAAESTARQLP